MKSHADAKPSFSAVRPKQHAPGSLRTGGLVAALGMFFQFASPALSANRGEAVKDAADLPGQGEVVSRAPAPGPENDKSYIKLLPRTLCPTEINTSPLPKYDYAHLDYALSEGLAATQGGRLWVCWVAGGDNDKAFVLLASSDDRGQTWSKPRAAIDPHQPGMPIGHRSLVANIWTDPRGRLWVFFDRSLGYFDGRAGVWAAVCENPDGDQPSWSAPQRLWHGAALNKPIVGSNGDWLLPVSLWPRELISRVYSEQFHDLDAQRGASVLASRDEGKTWERRGGVLIPRNATVDEPVLVERKDGSLWMTLRSKEGIWESVSRDGARTWSPPVKSSIVHVNSRHAISRLKSGRLLLVKHGVTVGESPKDPARASEQAGRDHLTAFLSEDDGVTWSSGLLLFKPRGSYPDIAQAQDGTLFVCYDQNRWFNGEIWMARFTEADVLAGRFVSPNSNPEMLVCRAAGLTETERAYREKRARDKESKLLELQRKTNKP